jgi:hypothetical protein
VPNVSFLVTKREKREIDREVRVRKVALATVARRLLLRHLGIKESEREMRGPRATTTAARVRRRKVA